MIMRTLNLKEMENLQGGGPVGCAASIVGAALTFAGLAFVTGGAAAVFWAVSWSVAPSLAALGCSEL